MSVFNPVSLTGQPDQKKALLDRLMQQYQEHASRAAGLMQGQSSLGGSVGSTPFHSVHPFGGMGLVTALAHALPPGLAARLGPGAIGVPDPRHTGNGIIGTPNPNPHPHGGGNIASAGGPSNPIAAVAAAAGGGAPSPAAAVVNANGSPAAPGPSLGQDVLSAWNADPNKLALAGQIVQRRPNIYNSPFHAFGIGGRV